MTRAVILANGELGSPEKIRAEFRPGDLIIVADGGARHAVALGLAPACVVGDLDSADPEQVRMLADGGAEIIRHPERKDQTDLELAVDVALARHAQELVILGALGGRLDMTLANVLLLARKDLAGRPLRITDGQTEVCVLKGPGRTDFSGRKGRGLSLISLTPETRGITLLGMDYPLTRETLALGSHRGVSNRVLEDSASIQVEDGILVVVSTEAK